MAAEGSVADNPKRYKAFISYSHAADGELAPAIQSALKRFARPWYRIRWVPVFRDETNLSLNPRLWSTIEKALGESEYFILLASPGAATSKWVWKEVDYWLKNNRAEKLLIVLTDGDIVWDDEASDFNWDKTTALPKNLSKAYGEPPLYAYLRDVRTLTDLSLKNSAFRTQVAKIAAPIQGRSLEEIFGEEVQQRRIWTAVLTAIILFLLATAGYAAWKAYEANLAAEAERQATEVANQQRAIAEEQRRIAISEKDKAETAAEAEREATKMANTERKIAEAKTREALMAASAERKAKKAEQEAKNDAEMRREEAVRAADAERKAKEQADERRKEAEQQRHAAEEQRRIAVGRQLGAEAPTVMDGSPDLLARGVLLAIEAARHFESVEADQSLRKGLSLLPQRILHRSLPQPLTAIASSRDGKYLATGTKDGYVQVLDTGTWAEMFSVKQTAPVRDLKFRPTDGEHLAIAMGDSVEVRETSTGKEIWRFQQGGEVNAVTYSTEGRYVATGSQDRMARIYEADTGREIAYFLHEAGVYDVKLNPDDRYLATASRHTTVWEIGTGKLKFASSGGEFVQYSDKGNYLAIVGEPLIEMWDFTNGIPRCDAEEVQQTNLESGLGRSIFTKAVPCRADTRTQESEATDKGTPMERVHGDTITFNKDERHVAIGTVEGNVRVWELKPSFREIELIGVNKDRLSVVPFRHHRRLLTKVRFSHEGNRIAVGKDKVIRVWDVASKTEVARMQHDRTIKVFWFHPAGEYLYALSDDDVLSMWSITERKDRMTVTRHLWKDDDILRTTHLSSEDRRRINNYLLLGFSRDGKYLSAPSLSQGYKLRIWAVSNGEEVDENNPLVPRDTWEITGGIFPTYLSREGVSNEKFRATASGDTVHVWLASGTEKGKEIAQLKYERNVVGVSFSPDDQYLITLCEGEPVRIWELPDAREVARIEPDNLDVATLSFSPDGRYLATATWDGTIELWLWRMEDLINEACSRLTRNLTREEWKQYLGDEPYRKTCPDLPGPV